MNKKTINTSTIRAPKSEKPRNSLLSGFLDPQVIPEPEIQVEPKPVYQRGIYKIDKEQMRALKFLCAAGKFRDLSTVIRLALRNTMKDGVIVLPNFPIETLSADKLELHGFYLEKELIKAVIICSVNNDIPRGDVVRMALGQFLKENPLE
ncbi:MAG: hypothetical protein AB9921_02525 [Erysipelotrichaceae bacterium]